MFTLGRTSKQLFPVIIHIFIKTKTQNSFSEDEECFQKTNSHHMALKTCKVIAELRKDQMILNHIETKKMNEEDLNTQ